MRVRFEHLVQINDPLNPLIEPLQPLQVWQGLVLRAEQPQLFTMGLQGARVIARGACFLARELDFGAFKVRDRVRLEPMQRMTIETQPTSHHGAGFLIITIEAPCAERLQLRFEYEVQRLLTEAPAREVLYDRFVKAAYLEADIDCVRVIREYAAARTRS